MSCSYIVSSDDALLVVYWSGEANRISRRLRQIGTPASCQAAEYIETHDFASSKLDLIVLPSYCAIKGKTHILLSTPYNDL